MDNISEEKKMKVGPGMFVAFQYKLYNAENGELLFEVKGDAPDTMVYGISHEIVPGLTAAVKDLSAGDRFEVTLPPAAAFGDRYEDNVVTLEKDIFMVDGELAEELQEGALLPMMTAEGFRIQGKVLEIGPDSVKMDFNHPFAGLTVRYDGEIVDVREATAEELKPAGGCCGGCGGGSCGDSCGDNGCGGSCGDSCECK